MPSRDSEKHPKSEPGIHAAKPGPAMENVKSAGNGSVGGLTGMNKTAGIGRQSIRCGSGELSARRKKRLKSPVHVIVSSL
jgi:hypothetical protein